ncbi:MAG: hypothetical protein C0597_09775 [Marinilabiliales bacterium]|nr:MAG: hypothetical protein C0597_09775 [Marinilabiliales bacterium]
MRNIIGILLLVCNLVSYSQEDSYQIQLKSLQQKLIDTEQEGLKVPVYKEIITISFPEHLEHVISNCEELNNLAIQLNNADAMAFANFYLGEYYFTSEDFEKAKQYYLKSLEIYNSLENSSQMIHLNHYLGLSNQYLNNYDEALVYYQNAIRLAESIGNKERVARSYHCIGTLYNDLEKYSLAQDYYERALKNYSETGNEERMAAIYQNFGVLHYNWGNFVESLNFYEKSLNVYEDLDDKQSIGISLSNIGLVYEESENYEMALDYYQQALIIFEEIGSKQMLVYIFYNLGSIYRNINDYNRSLEFFQKGLDLSKEISMTDYISHNYEALSGIYDEIGLYKQALIYYKEYVFIKDSLFNEEKHNQIAELEAMFQTQKQEKEIDFLKLDQELQEAKIKKKENQNLILIISSILVLIIAFVLLIFARSQRSLSGRLQNEIEERIIAEEKLRDIKEDLEIKVLERTSDIEESNQKLRLEIEKHKQTMKDLELAKNMAEEADRLKSNFLANISHEIRTPMNSITGFSQMLAFDNVGTDKRNEYISLVQQGCNDLTHLIDDIVDFATIDSGQAQIEIKEFNPHPMMEFLLDHFTNELLKREKDNLALEYANENSEIDILINSDQSRLKQILSILIDNAIKFTKNGYVEFGFTHPKSNEIQFFVRDTGIGIAEEHFKLIFERFRQVDESTTKEFGGAGIGLSVAKNLVRLLKGQITLESSPNRGSTFYVVLPFQPAEKERVKSVQPSDFNCENKIILVAEDKKINFEIIQETLVPTNANLLWAKNGKDALDMIKKEDKIDLVLLDIQMPVMDGYECATQIKKMTQKIPVIAQTAYALPQDSYKCFDAGCDDYIAKPISMDQFLSKLDKYLS